MVRDTSGVNIPLNVSISWIDDIKEQSGQTYLHSCMTDIGNSLDVTLSFLPKFRTIGEHYANIYSACMFSFCVVGIPAIRTSQKHSVDDLDNLATVATLFSGVTATMLSLSWSASPKTPLADGANTLWFISLILSISAAVNSLLGHAWTQATL
jgi:hypothetical protein